MNRFKYNDGFEKPPASTIVDSRIVIGARFRLNPIGRTYSLEQSMQLNATHVDVLPEFVQVRQIDGDSCMVYDLSRLFFMKKKDIKRFYEVY